MPFWSDNTAPAAPAILEAVARANAGAVPSYGDDTLSAGLDALYSRVFGTEVRVFPVATGTAANALALALLAPPYGAVFCHDEAHVHVDECGAPEFYGAGLKLVPVGGPDGRLAADALEQAVARLPAGFVHNVQPAAVSLTQATECGTVYTPDQIAAVAAVARRHGLGVHMDGARFANAVAALGSAPADLTWRAGVDILSFGATKNGALAAEAVVLFRPEHAERLGYLRKRAGHLLSKMRFVSAQLAAYVADDLWLDNARHANAMAGRLAHGLADMDGVTLAYPVEANEVFALLPEPLFAALDGARDGFHPWPAADRTGARAIRLVTSFATSPEDVARFLATLRAAAMGQSFSA